MEPSQENCYLGEERVIKPLCILSRLISPGGFSCFG